METVRKLLVSLVFVAVLVVAACAPQSAPVSGTQTPIVSTGTSWSTATPSTQAVALQAWETQWNQWVEGAKKEGTLVFATTQGDLRVPYAEAMEQKYGLQMEVIVGKGGTLSPKITAERRAGIYSYDIYVGNTTTMSTSLKPPGYFDPLDPVLILPESIDPKAWLGGKVPFFDSKDHQIVETLTSVVQFLAVNTDLVKPGEIESYKDLLNPKWKGKIIMEDPTAAGQSAKGIRLLGDKIMGWDYLRDLAKQEPVALRDERMEFDWLIFGKAAMLIAPGPTTAVDMIKLGAPIKLLNGKEGIWTTNSGAAAIFNRAPNSNAAKVFVNWFMSRDGQLVSSKTRALPTMRLDVNQDFIERMWLPDPKVSYLSTSSEEFILAEPEGMKKNNEIFGKFIR